MPERLERHVGKRVVIPAGAPPGLESEDVTANVESVHAVVKTKDSESQGPMAECTWVYHMKRTNGTCRLVSCVDMLPLIVPKRLVAQEKKMEKVLSNARELNFSLGERKLETEYDCILGCWWFEKT